MKSKHVVVFYLTNRLEQNSVKIDRFYNNHILCYNSLINL